MDIKKVSVIGAGSWGTAVANVFADAGAHVLVWGRNPEIIDGINRFSENPHYLKGLKLSQKLRATSDIEKAVTVADLVVCAVPTQNIESVFKPIAAHLSQKPILNAAKGIERRTNRRVSEIFQSICPESPYAIVSGPSFAEETVKRLPTAVTLASTNQELAKTIQEVMHTPYFRAYSTQDVIGVEWAGAMKNVIAIASGLVTGLHLGHNALAATINRGLAEIARSGRKLGADTLTFLGLAGMGDLVLTCTGPLSRNRTVGILLAQGKDLSAIQKSLGGVAEGVFTADSAWEIAREKQLEMPILLEIRGILYEGRTPQEAVQSLMSRDLRAEI
jgi:glycerol-3-phosphate dehydrogenase (NAD(P)+)